MLRAYGAEVVVCPTAVDPADPRSLLLGVRPAGPRDPRRLEARPVLQPGQPALALRDHRAGDLGADRRPDHPLRHRRGHRRHDQRRRPLPQGGLATDGCRSSAPTPRARSTPAAPAGPYLVEGVGEDFWPSTYDQDVADEIIAVSDGDSFAMTRRLAREEGLLVGGSCGMAVVAALRVGRAAHEGRRPGGAAARRRPRLPEQDLQRRLDGRLRLPRGRRRRDRRRAAARPSPASTPTLVHTHPNETVRDAIDILREYGVSQLPVVRAEPPVTAGEVVGSVDEKALLDALFAGKATPGRPGGEAHVARRCRSSAPARRSSAAVAALGAADALLVHVDGKPAGVVTRQDVLGPPRRARRPTVRLMSGFDTRAIHAGQEPDPATGAVIPPLHLTHHLQAGRRRRAARRLRVQPQRQPHPHRAAGGAGRPRAGHHGAGVRLRARRRGHPAAHGLPSRATTSCSAATPTAARSG